MTSSSRRSTAGPGSYEQTPSPRPLPAVALLPVAHRLRRGCQGSRGGGLYRVRHRRASSDRARASGACSTRGGCCPTGAGTARSPRAAGLSALRSPHRLDLSTGTRTDGAARGPVGVTAGTDHPNRDAGTRRRQRRGCGRRQLVGSPHGGTRRRARSVAKVAGLRFCGSTRGSGEHHGPAACRGAARAEQCRRRPGRGRRSERCG